MKQFIRLNNYKYFVSKLNMFIKIKIFFQKINSKKYTKQIKAILNFIGFATI